MHFLLALSHNWTKLSADFMQLSSNIALLRREKCIDHEGRLGDCAPENLASNRRLAGIRAMTGISSILEKKLPEMPFQQLEW